MTNLYVANKKMGDELSYNIYGNYNTENWNLGSAAVLSSDSEDCHNHVVSKAPNIMSKR